jgi:hypothetical protein
VIKDERLGKAEDVRAQLSPPVLTIFDRLRSIMAEVDDASTETASPKEKSLYFGLGRGKMTDGYAYIMGHGSYVNLGFFHGVDLPDPDKQLEGTGKKLRHIKIRTLAEANALSTRAFIEDALKHMIKLKGRP